MLPGIALRFSLYTVLCTYELADLAEMRFR